MAIYKQAPPLHDLPLHCMKNTKIYFALFAMNSPMKTTIASERASTTYLSIRSMLHLQLLRRQGLTNNLHALLRVANIQHKVPACFTRPELVRGDTKLIG